MTAWICVTCGVQHRDSAQPPSGCAVCQDERQYVGHGGQRWIAPGDVAARHTADIRPQEPGLTGIGIAPPFAIGQRALLVDSPEGAVLWDCVPLLDATIEAAVSQRGGLQAIAISHPHFHATMVDWAERFDAPVLLHAADRRWVMRPSDRIRFWDGEFHELAPGVTLVRLGGHFAGATVLHWRNGCGGRGALLSGDIVTVVQDRRWVSFMRSYPNLIPLPAEEVLRMAAVLQPLRFERIYGGWYGWVVAHDGGGAVARSARRYVAALQRGGAG